MPHKTLNALDNECHVLFTFLKFPFKFEIKTHILLRNSHATMIQLVTFYILIIFINLNTFAIK